MYAIFNQSVDPIVSEQGSLLQQYLAASPQAQELLHLLSWQSLVRFCPLMSQNTGTLLESIVLDALSFTLAACKESHARAAGTAIIRSILAHHMKSLYRSLSSGKIALVQATLFLLLQMAHHGASTTHHLHSVFNFNLKALAKFPLTRKKTAGTLDFELYRKENDVRSLYVQFLMAFLRKGDASTRQAILESNDLIGSILSGLSQDSHQLVTLVLSTLQKTVLEYEGLSRNVKLSFFNNKNLERLLALYSFPTQTEDGSSKAQLVHAFLIQLTTFPGTGVCYQDNGFYPPTTKTHVKVYNKILAGFLEALKPLEDALQRELLLKILKACPELTRGYVFPCSYIDSYFLKLNALPLDQFSHTHWEASIEWVMQLISLPIPHNFGAHMWSPPSASTLSDIILPLCFSRVSSTKALQNANRSVKEVAARLLCTVFEKMAVVLSELSRLESLHTDHAPLWQKCRQELLESLKRKLPEFQIILALHNYANSDTSQGHLQLARLVYKLLAYYQESFPDTVLESRFNPGKVITTDLGSMPLDIQYSILSLLKSSTELKWWQNIADRQDSYLKVLLQFHVNINSPDLRELSANAICHCLSSHFPFEAPFSYEAMYPLYTLYTSSRIDQSLLIDFVDSSLRDAQKEPYKIMDAMIKSQSMSRSSEMELDTTNVTELDMGYTLSCLFESLVKTIKTENTESRWTPIIKFISRIVLSLVRGAQVTGNVAYNLCADYLEQIVQITSGLTVGETYTNQLLNVFQEMMNAVQFYCEQAYPQMDVEMTPKIARTEHEIIQSFKKEELLGTISEFSQDDLCITLTAIQHGRLTLSKQGSHELMARLLQEDFCISSKLIQSVIPSLVEHHLPFSVIFVWTLRGRKEHLCSILSNRIRAASHSTELYHHLSGVVLELRSALHSQMTEWQSSLCMDLIYELVSHISRTQNVTKPFEVSSFASFLELIVSAPDFLESLKENHIAKDVVLLLNRLVRLGSLDKFLLPFLKRIETCFRSSLMSDSCKLSSEMYLQLLGLFEMTENKAFLSDMIELLLKRQTRNYQQDLDTVVIFLVSSRLQNTEPWTFKLQTWEMMLRQWRVNLSEKWSEVLCRIVSTFTGTQTGESCSGIYVEREQGNRFGTVSYDITQSFSSEHLDVLSKSHSIIDARLLACLVKSNVNHRSWYTDYILNGEFEHFAQHNWVVLKCYIYAHVNFRNEDSLCWKPLTTPKTVTAIEKIWRNAEAQILEDLLLIVKGKMEHDDALFSIARVGWYLLGSSVNVPTTIERIIPELTPSKSTSWTLGELLKCVPAKVKEESVNLLIISLRILRGCLLLMKKEGHQDIDIDSTVSQIVIITKSLLNNLNQTVLESIRLEDSIKHLRNFFTVCLKSYYGQPKLFSLLRNLYQLARGASVDIYSPSELLDMICTHSKFIHLISKTDAQGEDLSAIAILEFAHFIMFDSPSSCFEISHLDWLIKAYKGTTARLDRIILTIFAGYEREVGLSVLDRVLKHWSKDTEDGDLTSIIDATRMIQTLTEFPVDQDIEDVFDRDAEIAVCEREYPLYDISFFLPFTNAILEMVEQHQVDLLLLIQSNLAGLAVVALSSKSEKTRRACVPILSRIQDMIYNSTLKERQSLWTLLESFKNAIEIQHGQIVPRIPLLVATFVAQSLTILLKPESSLYSIINRFLLQRPMLDLVDVPMFYEMVYSSAESNKRERLWIVRLLSCGLGVDEDYRLYKRRHVIEILMGLYQSPVADAQIKKVIIESLARASKLPNTSLNLIHKSGLGTFLHACTINCTNYTSDLIAMALPTIIKSFAEIPSDLESSQSASAFVGMVNSLSVYLKGLLDWIITKTEADDSFSTTSLMSHTLNTLAGLITDQRVRITPFSVADLLKLICCIPRLPLTKSVETLSPQKGAPSDMFFASLGPPIFTGSTRDVELSVIRFITSVKDLDFSDPLFGQLLEWVSNRIENDDKSVEAYAKWLISCRLSSSPNVSFLTIQCSTTWGTFMTRLYRISGIFVGNRYCTHNIYNTLFMLILRDISAHQPALRKELSGFASLVPSPRSIVEQPWSTDDLESRYPKGEEVFAYLRSILWGL